MINISRNLQYINKWTENFGTLVKNKNLACLLRQVKYFKLSGVPSEKGFSKYTRYRLLQIIFYTHFRQLLLNYWHYCNEVCNEYFVEAGTSQNCIVKHSNGELYIHSGYF